MQLDRIQRDLDYLTGPEAAGRQSGTSGAKHAAAYLSNALAASALIPLGYEGYFQQLEVPAARITGPARLTAGGRSYRHRRDFAEMTSLSAGGQVKGDLVVVTEAAQLLPEELKGRVALIPKRPEGFDLGATAAAVADAEMAALLVEMGEPRWFHKTLFGSPRNRIPVIRVRESVAAELAALPGTAVELDLPLAIQSLPCQNVLGLLPGTGSAHTVALTAHYDHVGDDPEGERFPGALDNASGVATILEVVRRLVERNVKLPFDLVVGFLTGEESGLWGARHLAAHPPQPLSAVINLDGMGQEPVLRAVRLGYARPGAWIADLAADLYGGKGIAVRWTTGTDDSAAFQAAGLPALGLAQVSTEPQSAGLHMPDDASELLHLPTIREGAETIISLLQRLTESSPLADPKLVLQGGPQHV